MKINSTNISSLNLTPHEGVQETYAEEKTPPNSKETSLQTLTNTIVRAWTNIREGTNTRRHEKAQSRLAQGPQNRV